MESERPDFSILTTSRSWSATPWDYSSMKFIQFKEDRSGEVTLAYGQTIYAVVGFQYEIPATGLLRLTYVNSESNKYELRTGFGQSAKALFEAQAGRPKEISYDLTEGDFRGEMNMSVGRADGVVVPLTYEFRWVLKFETSPYPEGLEVPFGTPLSFYGHRHVTVTSTEAPKKTGSWWRFWE